MIDRGKLNLLGVLVDSVDLEAATQRIIEAAVAGESYGASALAVHGVMTGVRDPAQRGRLNQLDLVTPDGQPVRWGMNLIHGSRLRERVPGPSLMSSILDEAELHDLPVYFYGSTPAVLDRLVEVTGRRYPRLRVAGLEGSKFRQLTASEQGEMARRIVSSGARITLVGLGCPRQEVFVYELNDLLGMPTVAVGAAFAYHAGVLQRPRMRIQRLGLEWLYRLAQEPRRLWRRYLLLGPAFLALLALQAVGVWRPTPGGSIPKTALRPG